MTTQTLEQKRAKHALDKVKSLKDRPGKYATYVKALPAAILMNGLGQALATECAASDTAHHKLAEHVSEWLLSNEAGTKYLKPAESEGSKPAQRLLTRMFEGDQVAYLWAQAEAMAYVTWLKKFANACLETSERE